MEDERLPDDQDVKICPRCVCIQAKLFDDNMIIGKESEIKITLGERWPSVAEFLERTVIDNEGTCCSCVGLLQEKFMDSFVEKVTSVFHENGYHCENFKLSVSLPVQSALFLENAQKIHDEAIKDIQYSSRGYSLKEILKLCMEPILEKKLNLKAVNKGDIDLDISVTIRHEESENKLLPKLSEAYPRCFMKAVKQNRYSSKKKKSTIYNATTISNVMDNLPASELKSLIDPTYFNNPVTIDDITLLRSPVYLGGRYNKMSRELSQTPWIVDGRRISEMSVEEYITLPIKKLFDADRCNFSSSGREDIDVRMLGNGRPFLVEIINSRHSPSHDEISALEKEINQGTTLIQVHNVSMVTKDDTKILKNGEEEKTKSYFALCYSQISEDCPKGTILSKLAELSGVKNLKIKQKTPIRVLHRRSLATREREIHTVEISVVTVDEVLKMVSVNPEYSDVVVPFKLEITTQAGTYVKEFVHGDFGRTLPNLGSIIGTTTDIMCLDVTAVNLEWPPKQ